MRWRSAGSVVAIIGLVSVMSACASPSTPSVSASTRPVSSYEAPCDDLVDAATLASTLGEDVQPISVFAFGQTSYPLDGAAQSVGGLNCAWGDRLAPGIWNGPSDPGTHSAQVVIVPDAGVEFPGAPEDPNAVGPWPNSTWSCSLSDPGYCNANVLVGSSWVYATIVGLGGDQKPTSIEGLQELAKPFIDDVISSIEPDGDVSRVRPTASPDATVVPTSCSEWVEPSTADSLFTTSGLDYAQTGGGGSPWDVAIADLGSPDCILELPDHAGALAGWTMLPGGSWAFSELKQVAESDDSRTIDEVDVAGLPQGSAFTECFTEPGPFCALNVSVRGDWVSVVVNQQTGTVGPTTERDVRTAAASLASLVVGTLAK